MDDSLLFFVFYLIRSLSYIRDCVLYLIYLNYLGVNFLWVCWKFLSLSWRVWSFSFLMERCRLCISKSIKAVKVVSDEFRKDKSLHRYLILENLTNQAKVKQKTWWHFKQFRCLPTTLSRLKFPPSWKVSQPQFERRERPESGKQN